MNKVPDPLCRTGDDKSRIGCRKACHRAGHFGPNPLAHPGYACSAVIPGRSQREPGITSKESLRTSRLRLLMFASAQPILRFLAALWFPFARLEPGHRFEHRAGRGSVLLGVAG